jgi:hypothetical protein
MTHGLLPRVLPGAGSISSQTYAPVLAAGYRGSANSLTHVLTVGQAFPIGTKLLVFGGGSGQSVGLTLADSKGNTWTRVALSTTTAGTSSFSSVALWQCTLTAALTATDTITMTRDSSGSGIFDLISVPNADLSATISFSGADSVGTPAGAGSPSYSVGDTVWAGSTRSRPGRGRCPRRWPRVRVRRLRGLL